MAVRAFLLLILLVASNASGNSETSRDLAPLLETHLEKTRFPALVAAVVRGTNIVAAGAAGVRKIGSPEKVTVDDKFHIGSCTKSITALLAAFLDRHGVISMTNTVGDVLTNWAIPSRVEAIPLNLLLQNRSGLGNVPDDKVWKRAFMNYSGSADEQRKRFLQEFLRAPLAAEPGSKYIYSNHGYALAGAMLEAAANKPWESLVQEKIFERLSLKSGGFGPPSISDAADQPSGHIWKGEEARAVAPADNPRAIAPAGAVHLSILDCALYAAFHLQAARGEIPELRPYRTALYTAPKGSPYAMGWIVQERKWAGGKVLTHSGSNTMFYTVIWIAPERNIAFVVATNVGDRGDLVSSACDTVVGDLIQQFITSAETK